MTTMLATNATCTGIDASFQLTEEQINEYLVEGVLVVENVLTCAEIQQSLDGFQTTLDRCGVNKKSLNVVAAGNTNDWDEESAKAFSNLSSTNGSGGVLDLFYEDWKMCIATHPKLWTITKQLWKSAYDYDRDENESCDEKEMPSKESLSQDVQYKWHPYGSSIDYDKGYMYIDRIGCRLPSKLAQELGDHYVNSEIQKKKARSIQRSLTPHLDCCPDTIHDIQTKSKWRPIQCFISLTDNLEPNTGGFEACKGFHRTFDDWVKNRQATVMHDKSTIPPPCIGEYTHMRPKEDWDIYKQMQHVPGIKAGSAVFWDNRIPHANSYKHHGPKPRIVVYCSFLPDIELNRRYVQKQLRDYQSGILPKDQWNHINDGEDNQKEGKSKYDDAAASSSSEQAPSDHKYQFTDLGRKLIGLEPW